MFPQPQPEPIIELGLNQPVPASPGVPAAESLQFRTAEVADESIRRCTLCSDAIPGDYYHVGGSVACPRCAQTRRADQQRTGGWPEFGRAAVYGLGAAIAGSALTAIVANVVHLRIGWLAVVVGIMVGKAVLKGSQGGRGRRYQVLALLLTYFGISTSYAPEIVVGIRQAAAKVEAQRKAAGNTTVTPSRQGATPLQFVLALVLVIALSLAAPFLLLFQGAGFIDAIIIAIGLRQAWKLARSDTTAVMGPYAA